MYSLERYTLPEVIERSSARYAERPALSMVGGEPVLYSELEPRTRRIAALLELLGAQRGDRIALISENCPEWGLAYFGIVRSGCIAVPILTDFIPEQMKNILDHAGCRVVIASKRIAAKLDKAGALAERLLVSVEDPFAGEAMPSSDCPSRGCRILRPARHSGRRRRLHRLHIRHDGSVQGRHAHPSQHHFERRGQPLLHRLAPYRSLPLDPPPRPCLRVHDRFHHSPLGRIFGLLFGQAALRDGPTSRPEADTAHDRAIRASRTRKGIPLERGSRRSKRFPYTSTRSSALPSSVSRA